MQKCQRGHPSQSAIRMCFLIFTARCYAEPVMPQYVICPFVQPYVCPSLTFRYRDHIDWNTSKIISRLISLRYLLTLTPTSAIWSNGNTPKIGWNRDGFITRYHKNLQYLRNGARYDHWPRLLWRTNRKSHTRFRLVPKSMTLDDHERPKKSLVQK